MTFNAAPVTSNALIDALEDQPVNGTLQASDAENDSLLFSIFEKVWGKVVPVPDWTHTPLHRSPPFILGVASCVRHLRESMLSHWAHRTAGEHTEQYPLIHTVHTGPAALMSRGASAFPVRCR